MKSFSAQYKKDIHAFTVSVGGGYGERAPSVSEGYGFYLFNSYDGFDYVGDPDLKTEASVEANTAVSFKKKNIELKLEANYFYLPNYIIGVVDSEFAPMTIGAQGVKIYTNLDHAQLFNSNRMATNQ